MKELGKDMLLMNFLMTGTFVVLHDTLKATYHMLLLKPTI